MATNRLESFSDGVIAVAITLLVLGIRVPPPGGGHSLIWELGQQWPAYAAYVISFLTIGIIWINHHVMIARLRRTDHEILILNIILLMSIGILPFSTNLMADYLRQPHDEDVAAVVYGGALFIMALTFSALNASILLRKSNMLKHELDPRERRRILTQTVSGVIPYAVATPLALVSPFITLGISAALAVFYALPFASGAERPA